MKINITLVLMVSLCINSFSQTKNDANRALKEIEDAKSGNLLDAFAGFYQFAFKSVAVNEKSLDLNSTLFALVKNLDDDILHTQSRKSIVFLRNFQVNAKANLSDDLDFNGYSTGFTYAIWNKRDKGFINLSGLPLEKHLDEFSVLINAAIVKRVKPEKDAFKVKNNRDMTLLEQQELSNQLSEIGSAILNNETVNQAQDVMKNDLEEVLNAEIANSAYFQNLQDNSKTIITTAKQAIKFFKEEKANHLKSIENKPFCSLSSAGITDKHGKFNQASFEGIFLSGNRFGELDARVKYNYTDTISPSMKRGVLNGKIGYNFKLLKGKDNKSVFEFKLYGEYNKVLNNLLPDEKEEAILFNSDIRFRITDDLWIPLTIKYDKNESNFLGFLNVTYNFNSVKKE